jgi:hypothetical protein
MTSIKHGDGLSTIKPAKDAPRCSCGRYTLVQANHLMHKCRKEAVTR